MTINEHKLGEFLKEKGVASEKDEIQEIIESVKGANPYFLQHFIKYSNQKIYADVINRCGTMPMYSLIIKCPMLLRHIKMHEEHRFRDIKARNVVTGLVNNERYKTITSSEITSLLDTVNNKTSEGSFLSQESLGKFFNFLEYILKKETSEDHSARALVDRKYAMTDPELESDLLAYRNMLSIPGANHFVVMTIKVTASDFTESHLELFYDSLFLSALAALKKSGGKDVKVFFVIIKPESVIIPVSWHIPYEFAESMGTTPEEMVKKYISYHYGDIPEFDDTDEWVRITKQRKIKYCPYCGYNHLKKEFFN